MRSQMQLALLSIVLTTAIAKSVYGLDSLEVLKSDAWTEGITPKLFTEEQMTAWSEQLENIDLASQEALQVTDESIREFVAFIMEGQKKNELTSAQIRELADEGYSPKEMWKSAEFAVHANMPTIDVLRLRGKAPRETVRVEGFDYIGTDHSSEVWDPVIEKLGLDMKAITMKLGLPPADYERLVSIYGPFIVYEVTFIAASFNKDMASVWEEYEAVPYTQHLIQKYSEEVNGSGPIDNSANYEKSGEQIMEEVIRAAYNMTDDDVAFFYSYGIRDFNDMANALTLVARYDVELTEILRMYGELTWKEIEQELMQIEGKPSYEPMF